ncbi:hypothetical protein DUI87_10859 [Hirundo rustica rustica]|uniref:Uncharacterized protein n=1 Tax=Hirundo rustica rustica TaxID=333673 RepID=A0A3M0KPU9_HIRRU|nr:hypothetical protein DUI87_10859 [Hirundo rustica rustica]
MSWIAIWWIARHLHYSEGCIWSSLIFVPELPKSSSPFRIPDEDLQICENHSRNLIYTNYTKPTCTDVTPNAGQTAKEGKKGRNPSNVLSRFLNIAFAANNLHILA